ncbi:hypothetical protein KIW84_050574 [Lathyrus oleraceus]|uniref:Uncharacterized protein n=1 Tax=Pisum sativum TaxID=3888 RepID=A0A9D4WK26_PEA|nr:hypothetical protein KIW84_050574 [Pisum sativum]
MDQHRSTSLISPAESPAVASREKPAGNEEQQSRHRALFIPKEGKETLRVNLGKNMVSRPKRMGSGVGYAKGRISHPMHTYLLGREKNQSTRSSADTHTNKHRQRQTWSLNANHWTYINIRTNKPTLEPKCHSMDLHQLPSTQQDKTKTQAPEEISSSPAYVPHLGKEVYTVHIMVFGMVKVEDLPNLKNSCDSDVVWPYALETDALTTPRRNGLQPNCKTLLDATSGGSLLSKSAEEATNIINRMALNDLQSQSRGNYLKKAGVLELGTNDAILAQNKLISQQVELLTQQIKELREPSKAKQIACCELCKGEHDTEFCPPPGFDEVNYMANQRDYQPRPQQQQPYQPHPQNQQQHYQGNQGFQPRSNYYHNQGYGGGSSSRQNPPQNPYQPQPQQPPVVTSKLEETLTQFMQMSMANQKSNDAAIKK